jgi:rSAM/selenodomain-associated transferase 2
VISVVIPTYNEAQELPGCLAALRDQAAHRLIVAAGGSTAGTVEIAGAAGAVLVPCGVRQRAAQMNLGARRAEGDVLLFLHADTRLPVGALPAVEHAVASGAVGGCFRLRLEGPSPVLRAMEPLGDWHCRATHTTFGDRAIFARRDAFEAAGGYPGQEIMEDVELGRRLKRLGRLEVLPLTATASARHFNRQRGAWVAVKAALCCGLYDLGVAPRRLARFYWGQAYAHGPEGSAASSGTWPGVTWQGDVAPAGRSQGGGSTPGGISPNRAHSRAGDAGPSSAGQSGSQEGRSS